MRLKTIVASSMGEAMRVVRAELGEDAIIISSLTQDDGRVRVTAALEHEDILEEELFQAAEPGPPRRDSVFAIEQALVFHGVPTELSGILIDFAREIEIDDPVARLAAALKGRFEFSSILPEPGSRPIMLVGPPGAGKTVTAAKLAAAAVMAGKPIGVASTDTTRAAANEQLSAFTNIMGIDLKTAPTPRDLARLASGRNPARPMIIDTAGINPFDAGDVDRIVEFAAAADAEAVVVLSAGMDPLEAADVTAAFRTCGPNRIVTTRVDMARRIGGVLTSAESADLAFAEIGIAPMIANGLSATDPTILARLLMRDPLRLDLPIPNAEAAE